MADWFRSVVAVGRDPEGTAAPDSIVVTYNDPFFLADSHGIDDTNEQPDVVETTLEELANATTRP